DCDGFMDWEILKWDGPDRPALGQFFHKMQFRTLTKKFTGAEVNQSQPADSAQVDLFSGASNQSAQLQSAYKTFNRENVDYRLVQSVDELDELLTKLQSFEIICFDTETTGVDPMSASLLGIAFCVEPGQAYYVAVSDTAISINNLIPRLKPLFSRIDATFVAHNFKYDFMVLSRH